MADEADFSKMKVADLKKELKERGLSTVGAKSELLDRLKSAAETSTAGTDALLEEPDESIDLNNSNVLTGTITEQKPVVEDPAIETVTKEDEPVKTESTEEHPDHVKVTLACPTDTDRLKKRAERFGVINEDIKKQQRADRFGVSATESGKLSTAGAGTSVDVLKKRAERFGQVLSPSLSKEDEDERIKKRKERFGEITTTTNNVNTPPKFAKITFDSPKEDDKKKKRAERFGLV